MINSIDMTDQEFKFLVKEMRKAQTIYFKTRDYADLAVAKALEKQVDRELTEDLFNQKILPDQF
jgi:hypothetical protein